MIDTEQKAFNPSEHLLNIGTSGKPRWYLEAKWRLVWFREECPLGTIKTEILHLDLDKEVEAEVSEWDENLRRNVKVIKHAKGLVIFKATVTDGRGGEATGTKMENAAAFGDFLEKAETGSISRALAGLGYGTQFTDDMDEGNRLADSPVDRKSPPPPPPAPKQKTAPKPNFDPEGPATVQQLQSVKNLQKLLGMEPTSLEGLPFADVAQLIKELNVRLQEQKKNVVK